MKRFFASILIGAFIVALLSGCGKISSEQNVEVVSDIPTQAETVPSFQQDSPASSPSDDTSETQSPQTDERKDTLNNKINVQINGQTFTASLENNEAVTAFIEMLENAPVTIEMSDYSGFEKVGALGADLPASNSQITTQSGDIVLYQGNQIVIFYGSNSWSYTMIGRIDDLTGWEEALGDGTVTVIFSMVE